METSFLFLEKHHWVCGGCNATFSFSNKTNTVFSKVFMLFIFDLELLQVRYLQHIDLLNGK